MLSSETCVALYEYQVIVRANFLRGKIKYFSELHNLPTVNPAMPGPPNQLSKR